MNGHCERGTAYFFANLRRTSKAEAASYDKFACFCKEQADEKFYTITKAKKKINRLDAEMEELDGEIKELEAEELGERESRMLCATS